MAREMRASSSSRRRHIGRCRSTKSPVELESLLLELKQQRDGDVPRMRWTSG